MSNTLKDGLWPVMLTPFHDDSAIDWHGVDALTDWYLRHGSSGLFANCLSSEMYHLTADERVALVTRVVGRVKGRAQVVATGNFGGPLDAQAQSIRRMADTGVDAVVVLPNQLVTQEESEAALKSRFEALLHATGTIPLGLYEAPAPYKRTFSRELTAWLAATGRFFYLKDTTCEPQAIRDKLDVIRGTPLRLFNAYTGGALESLNDGAAGLSPIAANVYPELFSWLCANHRAQPQRAAELQRSLRVLEPAICVQYSAAAKHLLSLRGLPIGTHCRAMTLQIDHELISLHQALLETVTAVCGELGI